MMGLPLTYYVEKQSEIVTIVYTACNLISYEPQRM